MTPSRQTGRHSRRNHGALLESRFEVYPNRETETEQKQESNNRKSFTFNKGAKPGRQQEIIEAEKQAEIESSVSGSAWFEIESIDCVRQQQDSCVSERVSE